MDRHLAIRNTHPDVVVINGDTQADTQAWDKDGNVVTLDESKIKTEEDKLKKEYSDQAYARKRKEEYDALNQFEMQYDDKKNNTTTWDDAIDAIKAKYPKP